MFLCKSTNYFPVKVIPSPSCIFFCNAVNMLGTLHSQWHDLEIHKIALNLAVDNNENTRENLSSLCGIFFVLLGDISIGNTFSAKRTELKEN